MDTYVLTVARPHGWAIVGRYASRYTAAAAYNQSTQRPRRLLRIGDTGGEIIKDSEQDGAAADFAANNQKGDSDGE